MTEISEYEQQAIDFLAKTNTKFKAEFLKYGKHFDGDKRLRNIFKITLSNTKGSYSFNFGSSIKDSSLNTEDISYDNEPIQFYCGFKYEGLQNEYLSYSDTFKVEKIKEVMQPGKNPKYLLDKTKAKQIHQDFVTSNTSKYVKPNNLMRVDEFIDKIEGRLIRTCSELAAKNYGEPIQAKEIIYPNSYDVLACLTKYDPGTFENFCGDFGYDIDSRSAEKTYHAVVEEYTNLKILFSDEELELMQEIQ